MSAPVMILDGRVALWLGDVRAMLAAMEPDSVDCVVTSPPYWGLRDYGVAGQIGLEPTLGEHLAVMVEVFRLVRRVLKPGGTLWINYGDCYATSPNGRSATDVKAAGKDDRTFRDKPFSTIGGVLKPKDLCMVPSRLAIALQEDGWWVRAENIWGKSNPMPESIRDRPATAYEKVFLLTKSERYWYDAAAVRQGASAASLQRWSQDIDAQEGSHRANGGARANGAMKAVGGPRSKQDAVAAAAGAAGGSSGRRMAGFNERWDATEGRRRADSFRRENSKRSVVHPGQNVGTHRPDRDDVSYPRGEGRNLRNYEPAPLTVWSVSTKPFAEAHFATFPPNLAEICILAGCPPGGLVLDPFGGAGTTALVALRHGRRAALIELNPEYAEIARRRIEREWLGLSAPRAEAAVDYGPLFAKEPAE
ncbi:MAG: site-specific DNA-methyltransferase [Pseudomonadota bacterium]